MDNGGSMVEGGEWNSFSGVYVHEEADFMARLFPISPLNHDVNEGSGLSLGPSGWTSHESNYNVGGAGAESGSIYPDTSNSNNLYCFSQSSSYSGGSSVLYPTGEHENYYLSGTHQFLATNNGSEPIGFGMSDPKNPAPVQDLHDDRVEVGDDCLTLEMSCGTLEESSQNLSGSSEFPEQPLLKRELKASELDQATEEKNADNSSNNPRKRPPNPEFQKSKRNAKSKKNHKLSLAVCNEELDDNVGHLNRQVSESCCSEDESNASPDPSCGAASSLSSKGAINSSGKTRASRGSATDPQSLYARKRRERINERLKILQNLVPNGTKVDISTMLEEAVQYVKFLQLQIKLLSSDDMWMYAPLAYNGMDIGLDLKINGPR